MNSTCKKNNAEDVTMMTSRTRSRYLITAGLIVASFGAAVLLAERFGPTIAHAYSKLAPWSAKKQPSSGSGKVVTQSAIEAAHRAVQEAQAALDRALSEEKANPTAATHRAADEAAIALEALSRDVVKSLNERTRELAASIRQLAQALKIDAAHINTDPATKDLVSELNAAIQEIKLLSWEDPKPELEPNDDSSRADRIIISNTEYGARMGSVGRGDADFYSVEAKAGNTLRLDLKAVSGKKGRSVTAELLAPDTQTSLLTFDTDRVGDGNTPEVSVGSAGKYYLKITAKKKSDYQLAVYQMETQVQAAAPSLCTGFTFEGGAQGFTATGLWHLSTSCRAQLPGHTTPTTFYYGQEGVCNYNTGAANKGDLVSPAIPLSGNPTSLRFNYLLQSESGLPFDSATVAISTDGGATFPAVVASNGGGQLLTDNNWHSFSADISAVVGAASSIKVKFAFDSVDAVANAFTGWHVDDVAVCSGAPLGTGCPPSSSQLCLQDETNPANFVLIDSSTGAYQFFCNGVLIASGTGTPTVKACIGSIDDVKGDRRVHIEWDLTAVGGKGAGTAIVQVGPNNTKCQVTDKDMSNNACAVPPA